MPVEEKAFGPIKLVVMTEFKSLTVKYFSQPNFLPYVTEVGRQITHTVLSQGRKSALKLITRPP